jgi:hypothetical protein
LNGTVTSVESPGARAGNGIVARRVPAAFVPSYQGTAGTALRVSATAPAAHGRGEVFVTRIEAAAGEPSTDVAPGPLRRSYRAPHVRDLKNATRPS